MNRLPLKNIAVTFAIASIILFLRDFKAGLKVVTFIAEKGDKMMTKYTLDVVTCAG